MIFNSIEFFVFLPLVLLVYYRVSHSKQNLWLLGASYLFYGWWDPRFLFLISISTTIDFFCGKLLVSDSISKKDRNIGLAYLSGSCVLFLGLFSGSSFDKIWKLMLIGVGTVATIWLAVSLHSELQRLNQEKKRKLVLSISILANLSLLGFFKYFNFFIDSAETALLGLGVSHTSLTHLDIILPVGISFYTFQTMSYSIDIYRGKLQPCNKFFDFALFVAYFPQLVAGPIERATNLLPRIIESRRVTEADIFSGLGLICYGLFKKVVIADGLAGSVSSIYGTTGSVSGLDIAVATFLFTFQIYCDFSGYSDIARGTSRLLGIELMRNFRFPYFSTSPSEFWNRWHISLSSWLRDYLYISLGGNRTSNIKVYRNLMATMVLGGLWHGAAWNFVLWGVYQGTLLCIYRVMTPKVSSFKGGLQSSIAHLSSLIIFFVLTMYGWLLFRAESLSQIIEFSNLLFTDLFTLL